MYKPQRLARGQGTVEYLMLLGMIAAGALLLLRLFYTGGEGGIERLVRDVTNSLAGDVAGGTITSDPATRPE